MSNSSRCLVIFSGGQDSTTCLYWAKKNYAEVYAISFDYGQKHIIELESAKKICELAKVTHYIADIGQVLSGTSPLVNPAFEVKSVTLEEAKLSQLQDTFVPGRNILFLTLAASFAYVNKIYDIVIGVSQEDYGGYPDCRQDFIIAMEKALRLGVGDNIKIITPLINLNKKQTVEMANSLPGCMVALAYSTTCYRGVNPPCNTCHACVLRSNGFRQANIADPLLERISMN